MHDIIMHDITMHDDNPSVLSTSTAWRRTRQIVAVVGLSLCSQVALADLKISSRMTGKAMGRDTGGESVTYIKGTKMRSESVNGGRRSISILDLDKQQMIVLNEKKRRAEIFDLSQTAQVLREVDATDVKLERLGTSRTIAGLSCDDYEFAVAMTVAPMEGLDLEMDMVFGGPVCISDEAPGRSTFESFYTTAANKGLFFGAPVGGQTGHSKGMLELYRKMSELGVALATDITVKMQGDGPMASAMGRLGNISVGSQVLELSEETLSDDLFEIPSGWKVKHQKP